MTHDAFISYSRKDKTFATLLEKALEAYRPPKGLPAPRRHLVVFRDEDDFTGVDYHQALQEHLAESSKLIVICSPHARQSSYVNNEIARFAREKGAQDIIPILLSGLANNEARSGHEEEMAFPEALCELMEMPLAVDYRGFNPSREQVYKGVHYGQWYTLLANLFDVSRSEIEQRDKKRQAQRRTTALAVTSAVIAVLTGLLIFALISRNQAIEQRALADEQRQVAMDALDELTYEIPKLLERLPGTLPVRQRIVDLNIKTLRKLYALTPEDAKLARELATNYRGWADLLLEPEDRDFAGAYDKYMASAGFYDRVIEREPNNDMWHRDLAVSYYNAALMLERLGRSAAACKTYNLSVAPARQAVRINPRQPGWAKLLKDVEAKVAHCASPTEP